MLLLPELHFYVLPWMLREITLHSYHPTGLYSVVPMSSTLPVGFILFDMHWYSVIIIRIRTVMFFSFIHTYEVS